MGHGEGRFAYLLLLAECHRGLLEFLAVAPQLQPDRFADHPGPADHHVDLGFPADHDPLRIIHIGDGNQFGFGLGLESFFEFKGEDRHIGGGRIDGLCAGDSVQSVAQYQHGRQRLAAKPFLDLPERAEQVGPVTLEG